MDQITIRNMRVEEYATLKDLLYEAIYVLPGDAPPPRSVADRPELRVYFKDLEVDRWTGLWQRWTGAGWWAVYGAGLWMTTDISTMRRPPLRRRCIRSTGARASEQSCCAP